MIEFTEIENAPFQAGAAGGLATVPAQTEAERAAALYREIPDIRSDRVAEMRARIQAGAFDVSAEELADAILREARLSRLYVA